MNRIVMVEASAELDWILDAVELGVVLVAFVALGAGASSAEMDSY